MATYKELLAKKEQLDLEIENARRAEAEATLESVRDTIRTFGFTPEQVFGTRRKAKSGGVKQAQFRDPETGQTWGGRGPRPRWLKGKDPEQFRIRA